jgi:hypothetical protein
MHIEPEVSASVAGAAEVLHGLTQKRVIEHLDEAMPDGAETCVLDGHPCVLYSDGELAEDWSGEYVNPDLHPFALSGATAVSVAQFWELVRRTHLQS